MSVTAIFLSVSIIISLITLALGIVALHDVQKRNLAGKGRAIFAIITGALCLLLLIGINIPSSGSGGSSGGGGGRVNSNAVALAQLKQAAIAERDFVDALKRGNASDMREAAYAFDLGIVSGSNVSGYSPEFLAIHKEHYTAMVGANFARTRSGNSDIEREYSKQLVQKYIDSANRYTAALERETARLKSGGR